MLDRSRLWIPTPGINPSSRCELIENGPVMSVCHCGLSGFIWLVSNGFAACPGSFLSCHEENDPDLKSGRDLDPD